MKINIKVEFSETGKIAKFFHPSGELLAMILIHGFLSRALLSEGGYVFYGEMTQLPGYEILDEREEIIKER